MGKETLRDSTHHWESGKEQIFDKAEAEAIQLQVRRYLEDPKMKASMRGPSEGKLTFSKCSFTGCRIEQPTASRWKDLPWWTKVEWVALVFVCTTVPLGIAAIVWVLATL